MTTALTAITRTAVNWVYSHLFTATLDDLERSNFVTIPKPKGLDMVDTPDDGKVSVAESKDLLGRKMVIGLRNHQDPSTAILEGVNPKDKIGASKVDMTLLPVSAKVEWAKAQMDGAYNKYGPYNWRIEPVQIRTYVGAAQRHLDCFLEGEWEASDSMVSHLGHVMACCAILIDAITQGKFVDDRPVNGTPGVILDGNAWVKDHVRK